MVPKKSGVKSTTNKIPRPMNCFLAYRLEKQSEIVARCPGANHRDISKIIAKWWKEADDSEKAPYRERARLAKAEHERMYPNYKYTPQKKPSRPTRRYTKRPHDKFTSRSEENNRIMEHFFQRSPTVLQDNHSADQCNDDSSQYTICGEESTIGENNNAKGRGATMQRTSEISPASSHVAFTPQSHHIVVAHPPNMSPCYLGSDVSPLSTATLYPPMSYPSSPHSVSSIYTSNGKCGGACSPKECALQMTQPIYELVGTPTTWSSMLTPSTPDTTPRSTDESMIGDLAYPRYLLESQYIDPQLLTPASLSDFYLYHMPSVSLPTL